MKFPEVRVVEASAGSGKTHALAKRYLQLLMQDDAMPEDAHAILAITFTNAAAREMKERILELLKKIALGGFSAREERMEKDLMSALGGERVLLRKKAYALVDHLVRHYNDFQVHTIDSFVNLLLSGCASELGLSANFEIQRDSRECLAYSLDRCIDDIQREGRIRRLLELFLDQYLIVEDRSGWSPRGDILEIAGALYDYRNYYGGEFAKSGVTGAELMRRRRELHSLISRFAEICPEGANKRFVDGLNSALEKSSGGIDVGRMKSVYFERDEFPMNKGYESSPESRSLWRRVREGLAELATDEARALFDCYIDILEIVLDRFRERAQGADLVFLAELNRRASELFDSERVSIPELYYRLAGRFRHYLIDEFQDTSILQWRNLSAMVEEALSTGGSLFYVGDRKQAIYRFRGGEVALFDALPRRFQAFHPTRESLTENHRSRARIVEFNNEIFSAENLRRFIQSCQPEEGEADGKKLSHREIEEILEIYRDSRQVRKEGRPGGYVKAEFVEGADSDERDELLRPRLIALLKGILKRLPPEDIAVLTRGNDEVEQVTSWLIREGVRVESERTLSIRYNPHIKELVSLLKFLNSPIDDLSFASFILGEMFRRVARTAHGEMDDFLFSLQSGGAGDRSGYLYREFRARYPAVWDACLDALFRKVGYVPLYELSVAILETFHVFDHFPASHGFFMKFLDLVLEREEEGMGMAAFLTYFENAEEGDLFVPSPGAGAVKVVTIHKAKGLQFPVVIVPFLDPSPRAGGRRGKNHGPPRAVTRKENTLSLLRLDEKYRRFSPLVRDAFREEYMRSMIDELNIAYVACTRARDELHIFIPRGEREGSAPCLIPPPCMESGSPVRREGREEREAAAVELPPPCYGDWIPRLGNEEPGAWKITRRADLLRGELLHCALSRIGGLEGEEAEQAIARGVAAARAQYPFAAEISGVETRIRALLSSERVRPFFFVGDGEVHCEKEIVDRSGRTFRIDRLVVKKGEVWIVDYKSSESDTGEQSEQVREYRRVVGEIYPARSVRGFLIFLDSARVEEVGTEIPNPPPP